MTKSDEEKYPKRHVMGERKVANPERATVDDPEGQFIVEDGLNEHWDPEDDIVAGIGYIRERNGIGKPVSYNLGGSIDANPEGLSLPEAETEEAEVKPSTVAETISFAKVWDGERGISTAGKPPNPFIVQERPNKAHYSGVVEPIDLIVSQNLDFLEGNVVKYVSRYKRKDGLADLMKAKQYLEWLIERELNSES